MNYRKIRGVIHNFNQSFLSWLNQIDGQPVSELLYIAARTGAKSSLTIDWIQENHSDGSLHPLVLRSVNHHRTLLEEFFARHNIKNEAIVAFRTIVQRDDSHQIHVTTEAFDDHGRRYNVRIF